MMSAMELSDREKCSFWIGTLALSRVMKEENGVSTVAFVKECEQYRRAYFPSVTSDEMSDMVLKLCGVVEKDGIRLMWERIHRGN